MVLACCFLEDDIVDFAGGLLNAFTGYFATYPWIFQVSKRERFPATVWIKGLQDGCLENWETTTGRGRKCKHKGLKFLYLINKNNKIQNMNYHIINKTLFLGRGNATEKIQNISPSLTICIKCESKK